MFECYLDILSVVYIWLFYEVEIIISILVLFMGCGVVEGLVVWQCQQKIISTICLKREAIRQAQKSAFTKNHNI